MQDRIRTTPPTERRRMLQLYQRVHRGDTIADDKDSAIQYRLKLYGLLRAENGNLQVRNRLYREIFAAEWVQANMPPRRSNRLVALAGTLAVVLLLAALFIVTRKPDAALCEQQFIESSSRSVRLNALACLFNQSDTRYDQHDQTAYTLFYDLPIEEQIDLFWLENPQSVGADLLTVVENLSLTLDTRMTHDIELMQAMRNVLADANQPADELIAELDAWQTARQHMQADDYPAAIDACSTAIAQNNDHPVLHFDRAEASIAVGNYAAALADLDEVMRIAQEAPPTPTPSAVTAISTTASLSPTATRAVAQETPATAQPAASVPPAVTPTVPAVPITRTGEPVQERTATATLTPTTSITPSLVMGHSRFVSADGIRAAVGEIIKNWAMPGVLQIGQHEYPWLVSSLNVPSRTNPRFPVTTAEWRNEIVHRSKIFSKERIGYWRYIPPGRYTIGGWLDDEWDDNDAQATIDLPAYWIAQYPITNQQYAQFIADGGYDTAAWWTTNGWQWKEEIGRTQPYFWDDSRFNADNQPVGFITWYEAGAFAAWLNAHLADELPSGYRIRLPTEAEWETACASDSAGNRHPYPWGDAEPTDALADFEREWGDGPAAVGEHPSGAAFSGAQNMVGSVWEGMTSNFNGYAAASNAVVADFARDEWDVPWCGGGWGDNRTYVRCAARSRRYPDLGINDYYGFRLVLSP